MALIVSDEGYSRNAACALNLISALLLFAKYHTKNGIWHQQNKSLFSTIYNTHQDDSNIDIYRCIYMYFIVSIIIKHNNTLNDDSKKNRIKRCGELNIYKNLCVIDTAQHMSTFGSSLKFSLPY